MNRLIQIGDHRIPAAKVRCYIDGKLVSKPPPVEKPYRPASNGKKAMTDEQRLVKIEARLRKEINSGTFSVADMAVKLKRNKSTADEYMRDLFNDGRLLKSHQIAKTWFYRWP
jgi:hypothetical protein